MSGKRRLKRKSEEQCIEELTDACKKMQANYNILIKKMTTNIALTYQTNIIELSRTSIILSDIAKIADKVCNQIKASLDSIAKMNVRMHEEVEDCDLNE